MLLIQSSSIPGAITESGWVKDGNKKCTTTKEELLLTLKFPHPIKAKVQIRPGKGIRRPKKSFKCAF